MDRAWRASVLAAAVLIMAGPLRAQRDSLNAYLAKYTRIEEKLGAYERVIESQRYDNRQNSLYFARQAHAQARSQTEAVWQAKGWELLANAFLINFDYDSSIYSAKQGLLLAKDNPENSILLNLYAGDAFWYKGLFDSSLQYYERGQRFAADAENKPLLATITVNIADYYRQKGDFNKSLEVYWQGLEFAKQDTTGMYLPKAYNNMALLYGYVGDTFSELDYYFKAVEAAQRKPHLARTVGLFYANISEVYASLGDYPKALEYIQRGIQKSNQAHQQRAEMNAYEMLTTIYLRMDSLDAAHRALAKSMALNIEVKDRRYIARNLGHLGTIEHTSGNFTKAIGHFAQAIAIQDEIGDRKHKIKNLISLAGTFLAMNQLEKAGTYNQQAIELSGTLGIPPSLAEGYLQASNIAERRGDLRRALRLRKHYDSIANTIEKQDRVRYTGNIEKLQLAKLKELENLSLKKDMELQASVIDRQQKQFAAVLILSFMLVIVVVTIYALLRKNQRSQKIIRQQNQVLKEKNEEIQSMSDQQEDLVHLVVHDLRSPLNKIEGLATIMKLEGALSDSQQNILNLIDEVTRTGKSFISEFLENTQMQYRSRQPQREAFDLRALLEEVHREYMPQAQNKHIELKCEINLPEQPALSDRGLLYHILINLVSNAIKYSPPFKSVILHARNEGSTLLLEVRDHGQGFSEHDKKVMYQRFQKLSAQPIAAEKSTGLGLFLTKMLVESLGGKISLESEVGRGSVFTLSFEDVY